MNTLTRTELGALGEQFAAEYLTGLGLEIIARNWRCRYGELDIVAAEHVSGTVVFVEVKTRTGDGYGGLAESVPARKVLRLRRLAAMWLAGQTQRWSSVRIDVIGVRVGRRRAAEITHVEGVG